MKSKEKLLKDLKDSLIVKRCHELEKMIDNNKDILELLQQKKHISKEMVAASHMGLTNTYCEYKKEYDLIDEKIGEYPLVCEYLEILDDLHNDLEIIIDYISSHINEKLEE